MGSPFFIYQSVSFPVFSSFSTECPKICCNPVLHLLKYTANPYLSRCSTDWRYIWGHSVEMF